MLRLVKSSLSLALINWMTRASTSSTLSVPRLPTLLSFLLGSFGKLLQPEQ